MRSPFRPGKRARARPYSTTTSRFAAQRCSGAGVLQRRAVARGAYPPDRVRRVGRRLAIQAALRAVSGFNDRVQALLFDPNKLAPTYPETQVLKPPRFNAYYDIEKVKPVDGGAWRLELAGLVADKRSLTRRDIAAMPQTETIVRHVCVEGWDYIGQWSGVPLRAFLERVGADLRAKYVAFKTVDDYPSSIDMATALHPQTLLATQYAREDLADPFGYPLRLRCSTKLGFKQPKWITAIEVTNTYPGGYWRILGSIGSAGYKGDCNQVRREASGCRVAAWMDNIPLCGPSCRLEREFLIRIFSDSAAESDNACRGGRRIPPFSTHRWAGAGSQSPCNVRACILISNGRPYEEFSIQTADS